jgi:hypothetical protein
MVMRTSLASSCQVEVTNLRTTACNFLIEVLAFALAGEFLRLALKYRGQQKDVHFTASHGPTPTPVSNYMLKEDDKVTSNSKHRPAPFTPQAAKVQKLGLFSGELAKVYGRWVRLNLVTQTQKYFGFWWISLSHSSVSTAYRKGDQIKRV